MNDRWDIIEKKIDKMNDTHDKQILEIRNIVENKIQDLMEKKLEEKFKRVSDGLSNTNEKIESIKSVSGNIEYIKNIFNQ
jgi:DNA anti-recombination protein RmuC